MKDLTAEENKRLDEELAVADKTALAETLEAIRAGEVNQTALITNVFDWDNALYKHPYWKKVIDRITDSNPRELGIVSALSFDKFQEKLETNLKAMSYRRVSLHTDDKHRYRSREQQVTVHTEGGYLYLSCKRFSLDKVLFRDVSQVKVHADYVVMHMKSGPTITIRA